MSLINCLRKAGKHLAAEDKRSILLRARELQDAGADVNAAARSALDEHIAHAADAVRELGGSRADEGLTSPTPESLRAADERARSADAADRAEQKRLANKERGDAQRGDFALSGSDRAADANQDQGRLFEPKAAYGADPTKSEAFKRWSDNATVVTSAQAMTHNFKSGERVAVEAWHGTARPDRIGAEFKKSRATSGPMSFFTSDPVRSSGYASSKQDTSLSYETIPYENWFKYRPPGERSDIDIARAWYRLSPEQQRTVRARAQRIYMDDDGHITLGGDDHRNGPGGYDQNLLETQRSAGRSGNPLKALVETWLSGGILFDNEQEFVRVLKLAGVPVEHVSFDDPGASYPANIPGWISFRSPLVTSDIPQAVKVALEEAALRDRGRAKLGGADIWDKGSRTLREWVKAFNSPDNEYVWTSIPDKVTSVFKALGYDGIIDMGGKGGGGEHRVYIPFEPQQFKGRFNRGAFDATKRNFLREPSRAYDGAATKEVADASQAQERAGQQAAGESTGYETDLFGNPLPAAVRGRNKRAASGDPGAAPAAAADVQPPAGEYGTRTRVVTTREQRLGHAGPIRTLGDAANALAYLGDSAVERLDALVTDKSGRPLAVVGGFKGDVSSVTAPGTTLIAEAFRVPGAESLWLVHNHPSGVHELSSADVSVLRAMSAALDGTGVRARGMLAIGDGTWGGTTGGQFPDSGKVARTPGPKVPVQERAFEARGKLAPQASTARAAADAARGLSHAFGSDGPGIMLLDSQLNATAFIPWSGVDARPLKNNGKLDALFRAVSHSNADAAIIYTGRGGTMDGRGARNLALGLDRAGVRVLDIAGESGPTAAEQGAELKATTLESRGPRQEPAPKTPEPVIRDAIAQAYGDKLLPKLEAIGRVTIAQTEAQALEAAAKARAEKTGDAVDGAKLMESLRAEDIKRSADGTLEGFFDPQTGRSFLVADNLTRETAGPTLMHEVGIHMAADGSMRPVFARAEALLAIGRGNPFIERVRSRMDAAGERGGEEAAAYIVTEYERDRTTAPKTVARFVRDFIADVRAWLARHGIVVDAGKLTVADIAAVARANARSLARGKMEPTGGADARPSFAGERSATADTHALARAERRLSDGEDAERVRQETGWHKSVDGKWRYEINDADARMLLGDYAQEVSQPLGDVLDHQALFAAYPALRFVPTSIDIDPGKTGRGSMAANGSSIKVTAPNRATALSILLHEVQHGIQTMEGFARGGSVSEFTSGPMFDRRARGLAADLSESLTGGVTSRPAEIAALLQYGDAAGIAAIAKRHGFGSVDDAMAFLREQDTKRTPRGQYRRLAGEVEARNTQARQGLNEDARRAISPEGTADVSPSDVIVRFNGKDADGAPTPANAETAPLDERSTPTEGERLRLSRRAAPEAARDAEGEREQPRARGELGRLLGKAVDTIGERTGAYKYIAPMSAGTDTARAIAQKHVNAERSATWEWRRVDSLLERNFTVEQRRKMWDAADEENDLLREGVKDDARGLGRLTQDERAVLMQMHEYSRELWDRASELGMVKGEGVSFWTPRMMVLMDGDTARAPIGERSGTPGGIGRNLRTSAPSMKVRKYDTSAESEAAMQAKGGSLVRDIRTMPMAMAKFERAIAGRELVNQIKELGLATGRDLVNKVGGEGYFTLDHPAFKQTTFRTEGGTTVTERTPLYMSKEFEGPLKAVLSGDHGAWYSAYMLLKSKAMSAIMVSPMIHMQVILGRAVAIANPVKLGYWLAYKGRVVKSDADFMRQMIDHGMVPIGDQRQMMDVGDLVNGKREGGWTDPNESWIALGAQKLVGMVDKKAGDAVKGALDTAGDFWHNALLWNRIGDLQAAIAKDVFTKLRADGVDVNGSATVAAHVANRYAGALGRESMSSTAHKAANLLLFSKSFNAANIGQVKDAFYGLPAGLRAQITENSDAASAYKALAFAKHKARVGLVLDLAYSMLATTLVQDWFARDKSKSFGEQVSAGLDGYLKRAAQAWANVKDNPFSPGAYNPHRLLSTRDNEPGKEDRVDMGAQPDTGRHEYMRLPTGKVIEDLIGWSTKPFEVLANKLSPGARAIKGLAQNARNPFGTPVYDVNDTVMRQAAQVAEFLVGTHFPLEDAKLLRDTAQGVATPLDKAKLAGKMTGFTVSQGHPTGPEGAVAAKTEERVRGSKAVAMEVVRYYIKRGDHAAAAGVLERAGLSGAEIALTLRNIESPKAGLSAGQVKKFNQHATEAERAKMEAVAQ